MVIQSVSQLQSNSGSASLLLDIFIDNWVDYVTIKKEQLGTLLIKYVLTGSHILFSRLICRGLNIKVDIPCGLFISPDERYLIVATHESRIDPYLILASLPYSEYKKLLPIRFFTANVFLQYLWQRCILLPFGSFRAYSTDKKLSGVKGALSLIDKGQSLFIFPEGKRVEHHATAQLKIGAGYLAQKRDLTILPVNIAHYKAHPNRHIRIVWGKPFKISQDNRQSNVEAITQHIFQQVLALS